MELSDFYPRPDELIDSELEVLKYLKSDRYITQQHGQFALEARTKYGRYRNRTSSGFEFLSFLDVWHYAMNKQTNPTHGQGSHGPNTRLILGTRVEVKASAFRNVTYCLAVCRLRGRRCTIRRKFHFDVAVTSDGGGRRSQSQPRCHLQYCGEMVPEMAEMGCKENQLYQMHPWLSEPRIFFWPMSLGLLLDMCLREFAQRPSATFRTSPEWRSIVRQQEGLLLKPFYEKCVQLIKNSNKQTRTLFEEFTLD
jgi:hypothetical protein